MQQSREDQISTLREHSRRMVRELGMLQQVNEDLQLTNSQCHALIELERYGTLSSSELSDLLRLDPSTTSRLLASLLKVGDIEEVPGENKRTKLLAITPRGKDRIAFANTQADARVSHAFDMLEEGQRQLVVHGMRLYATALAKARIQREFTIRLIAPADDPAVARVIRTVMPEFGAVGEGYSINDPEVTSMYEAYSGGRAGMFVVERKGRIVGCGGYAQVLGAEPEVCEIRKMYFLAEARGTGMGKKLLLYIMDRAREDGYRIAYLETLERMHAARSLYEHCGFKPLCNPMGRTGHHGCDAWYSREL